MREIKPCGDMALSIYFSDHIQDNNEILAFKNTLESLKESAKDDNILHAIVEVIPCYTSLFIQYNPFLTDFQSLSMFLQNLEIMGSYTPTKRLLEIPLCYDFGLDFDRIREYTGLSKQEIIHIHSTTLYEVRMLGFMAGFPYLLPRCVLDFKLNVPKLPTPRLEVKAGSVGIAEMQSGIYPLDTPGGWNIIGKTPLRIFEKTQGALLQTSDYIQFIAITQEEFESITTKIANNTYELSIKTYKE